MAILGGLNAEDVGQAEKPGPEYINAATCGALLSILLCWFPGTIPNSDAIVVFISKILLDCY
jgi:hypothetical protein